MYKLLLLIPAAFLFIAATIYQKEGFFRLMGILGGMSVAVMSLTVFLTLQWKFIPLTDSLLMTGGAFGIWIADLMIYPFNSVGASIISLLVFFLALVLSTPVSVTVFFAKIFKFTGMYVWKVSKVTVTYFAYFFANT